MINCPDCEKEISIQAVSCPHCGKPLKAPQKNGAFDITDPVHIAGLVIVILSVIGFIIYILSAI